MSAVLSFSDELKSHAEYLEKVKKSHEEEVRNLFTSAAKAYFEEYPFIHSLRWRHYTPSFNDGDPCYFTMTGHALVATHDAELADSDDYSDESEEMREQLDELISEEGISPWLEERLKEREAKTDEEKANPLARGYSWYVRIPDEGCDLDVWNAVRDAELLYGMLDEETAKSMFGDYVEITLTKDGATTTEFEGYY